MATGESTHHIVALEHELATESRKKLAQFGIDIDDAVNGVFGPAFKKSPNPIDGASANVLPRSTGALQWGNAQLAKGVNNADAPTTPTLQLAYRARRPKGPHVQPTEARMAYFSTA